MLKNFIIKLLKIGIPNKNINLMLSRKKGGMLRLAGSESMGGNAGAYKKVFPCVALNFFFDADDGTIIYFGNIQEVPENIIKNFSEGTFKVAVYLDKVNKKF